APARTLPAHFGEFLCHGRRKAAVMAAEPMPEAVLDQPRRALRTIDAVSAGAAQRERGVAAPVEEQQRLLLLRQRLVHGLDQHRREPFSLLGRMLAKVDGLHL